MVELALPFLVPLAGAALLFGARGRGARFAILLGATCLHLALTARLWVARPESDPHALLGLDAKGLLFLSVISLLYCLVGVHLVSYTRGDPRGAPRVFLACHLYSLAAMTLVCMSNHWGLFWVAMEATTLVTAPLLFYHHGPRALEATWKYLLVCSVGIALALLGTLFLGMSGAALPAADGALTFPGMVARAGAHSAPWIRMGAIFLVVGYGTKMGLAPMHAWKPDAYGEAPPPVAALLSGGLTNCSFLGLLRVHDLCAAAGEVAFLRSVFVALGLLSLAISAASIVGQANYRRMLAYSSVEHMGILTLALGVGGLAIFGALLHAVNNALNKGILFLAAGNILKSRRTSECREITGLFRTLPLSATLFVTGFFAATGFPPFGVFLSEFTILRGMFEGRGVLVPLLFLGFLAVVFIGMGAVVLGMVQGDGGMKEEERPVREPVAALLPIFVLVGMVLMLGIHIPAPLRSLLEQAARVPGVAR